ncbi:MAG: hypothetical protein AABZ77_08760 [Chloroflexota bacterium]
MAASSKPKIQIVAKLAAESAESLAGHLAGADAGFLSLSNLARGAETLQKLSKSQPDIIWGGWLDSGSGAEIKQLTTAGCDFIVFSANKTPVTLMKDDKGTGKILELEASITEGLLRTANELPIDAVIIAGEEKEIQALTWQQLMLFRRFADLLTKPLMVPVPAEVTAAELEALWEAGVTAVVMEIEAKQPEDRLMKLRQEIDKTEFPSRRSKRAEALVPRVSQPPGRRAAEEDDDDDDERKGVKKDEKENRLAAGNSCGGCGDCGDGGDCRHPGASN